MKQASYNAFNLIGRTFGQVPGGMFGAGENARKDDKVEDIILIPMGAARLRISASPVVVGK